MNDDKLEASTFSLELDLSHPTHPSEGIASHIQHQLGSDISPLGPPPVPQQQNYVMCDVVEGSGGGEVEEAFYMTENQRREQYRLKFTTLRSLIPNPTETDRASVVRDAIEYIKELRLTVDELKLLAEEKKKWRDRMKADDDVSFAADMERLLIRPVEGELPLDGESQRKSKDSIVDVHIIEDEVIIKLKHKRKASCLPSVARALDELQLDPIHVTGENMADRFLFMLKAKICKGSSVYAEDIANKLLVAMDGEHQALAFHDSF